MTSHELARKLLDGPDLPVHQSYPYGDYWHTQVAPEITSCDRGAVVHSAYHNMNRVVDDTEDADAKDDAEDDAKDCRDVILLS